MPQSVYSGQQIIRLSSFLVALTGCPVTTNDSVDEVIFSITHFSLFPLVSVISPSSGLSPLSR